VKELPHSLEAEQCALGAMLIDERALADGLDRLTAAAFFDERHQLIFTAVRDLYVSSVAVDIVTVSQNLQAGRLLDKAGGAGYLAGLASTVPTAVNAAAYFDIILRQHKCRTIIGASRAAVAELMDGAENDEPIAKAEQLLTDAFTTRARSNFATTKQALVATAEYIEHLCKIRRQTGDISGLDTGLKDLNTYTAGLHPGEVTIIAARPGCGKTALGLSIADHVAGTRSRDGAARAVAFFSLEMNTKQITMRRIAMHAEVDVHKIRNGDLGQLELQKILASGHALAQRQFYTDESTAITSMDIRSRLRRLRAECPGLALAAVDYIQLMDSHVQNKADNRAIELARISRDIKKIALELNLPMLVLCQINRDSTKSNQRPTIAQLRESGAIEQDADNILLLHPHTQDSWDDKAAGGVTFFEGATELIIGKQRNGPSDKSVFLLFQRQFTKFQSISTF
jgi:replicative DNA helicase